MENEAVKKNINEVKIWRLNNFRWNITVPSLSPATPPYYVKDDNPPLNFLDGNVTATHLHFNTPEKMVNCNLRRCNEFEKVSITEYFSEQKKTRKFFLFLFKGLAENYKTKKKTQSDNDDVKMQNVKECWCKHVLTHLSPKKCSE